MGKEMKVEELVKILTKNYGYVSITDPEFQFYWEQETWLPILACIEGIKHSLEMLKDSYELKTTNTPGKYIGITGEDVKVFREARYVKHPEAFKVILKTLQEELGMPEQHKGESMLPILYLAHFPLVERYKKGEPIVFAIKKYREVEEEEKIIIEKSELIEKDAIEILTYVPKALIKSVLDS